MPDPAKVKATRILHNGFSIPKGIVPRETLELSPEERIELRVLLNNPIFKRALEFAQLQKPSALMDENATAEQRSVRLAEIGSWEASLLAICLQAQTEIYDFNKHKAVSYDWQQPSGDNELEG